MSTTSTGCTRRGFLSAVAAGTAGVGTLAAMGECAATACAAEGAATPAQPSQGYDVMSQYTTHRRGMYPDKVRATTPEEFIAAAGTGTIDGGGGCEALGITPADFMLNVPAWLGEAPVFDAVADEEDCDVLVVGLGTAGTTCALRCAVLGAKVIAAESQTENEYDNYVCDMTCYNNRLFKAKGIEVDPMQVFEQYMRDYGGHVNQKLVRDFAMRGGEAFDFFLDYIPEEYVEKYAHANNASGHANFPGQCNGNYSFQGMTNWRDPETNLNMFPFVIRCAQDAIVENGGQLRWGYQGLALDQADDGVVTGAVFRDIDGTLHRVNAKAVVVATGGYGGNPDMRLDLSDSLRNIAWAHGADRNDVSSTGMCMGRDGFDVRFPAHYGFEYAKVYAAETLEELADIIGYDEEGKAGFIAEVAHWNEMCAAGKDEDWGVDACRLFPIDTPPYYATFSKTTGRASGGLEQGDGVCTDNFYRAVNGQRQPIPGLYVAGGTCGQRHGNNNTQVTAGNTCGGALTTGYLAAEVIVDDIAR